MTAAIAQERQPAELTTRQDGARLIVEPKGDWLMEAVGRFDRRLRRIESETDPKDLVIDLSGLGRIDTAGAYVLGRTLSRCREPDADRHFIGEHQTARRMMGEMLQRLADCPEDEIQPRGVISTLARIGQGVEDGLKETVESFAFFGRTFTTGLSVLVNPTKMRWTSTIHLMETAGVDALPIISVLSFFIGAVVAFMGASLLETFGASVFTVDLVGIAVLREFGVIITAILLAGRSDSAFTAAIGSMKMQQEIDAMKVMGLDPYEVLVLPRVIACVVMAPLLTLSAMVAGVFGGMLVSWMTLDISPNFFLTRLNDTIDLKHFLVGMSKAPVFGLVIAIVGCRHGLQVGGDVESLGKRVTTSVVQAIFAVIVIDALFAMMYLELDI
ncbi:ABC transporter, permease protein, putative [Oceanicaulis sp. HTCC2633]|uniref:ABC transporter permease n=1 Tax=Oceanicaulis sp. HTCC2633 TaxID=314254 RepID=UPI000066D422|nr:ABC transporter permease [Oceanicaulis sp. HTCC2633]EAP91533.1 ABC transporter, permease protein, putative [Oceanicaulis sp. HTCC2633]